MKQSTTRSTTEHRHAPGPGWPPSHRSDQRARLRVLIYTMEHDATVQAQPWQIESLRRMLRELEHHTEHPTIH